MTKPNLLCNYIIVGRSWQPALCSQHTAGQLHVSPSKSCCLQDITATSIIIDCLARACKTGAVISHRVWGQEKGTGASHLVAHMFSGENQLIGPVVLSELFVKCKEYSHYTGRC